MFGWMLQFDILRKGYMINVDEVYGFIIILKVLKNYETLDLVIFESNMLLYNPRHICNPYSLSLYL